MDKWEYIKRISEASDHYGDKLLDLMDKCGAYNLREVSEDTAKAYYEQLKMTHCCPLLCTQLQQIMWITQREGERNEEETQRPGSPAESSHW